MGSLRVGRRFAKGVEEASCRMVVEVRSSSRSYQLFKN
jgi:hypothetical protein